MRFIDEATIHVSGGHGGKGCVSFWREKFVPLGGPDGGEGGDGGAVYFQATSNLSTLQDFRFRRKYVGEAGKTGSGNRRAGKGGEDVTVLMPVGTIIRDVTTGEVIHEMKQEGEVWLCCKGGRGGKGNSHFATSKFQAPKFAQPGEPGEFKDITLELRLLADVGIIGQPNAGKSSLITRVSAARPKVADYAFTTLTPVLGVVKLSEENTIVMADIPGLIEGAHTGIGLGHRFLKHIERTRVLIHLMDLVPVLEKLTKPKVAPTETELAQLVVDAYLQVRTELGLYNESLLQKAEIVAINKIDVLPVELVEVIQKALRKAILKDRKSRVNAETLPQEPFLVSAATGQGVTELLKAVEKEFSARSPSKLAAQEVLTPDHPRMIFEQGTYGYTQPPQTHSTPAEDLRW